MSARKQYLLRISTGLWEDLAVWAGDELRSVNAQIEYLLREAVRKRKGLQDEEESPPSAGSNPSQE